MIDFRSFENVSLRGGFTIVRVKLTAEPMLDALGPEASRERESSDEILRSPSDQV